MLPTDTPGSNGRLDASPQGAAERVLASRPRQRRHRGESQQGGPVSGWWPPLCPLPEHLLAGALAALPHSWGIQEMAIDWLYDYVFFETKMLLI